MMYGGEPIICEECGIVLEEASGYTIVQYGICDDCLANVDTSPTEPETLADANATAYADIIPDPDDLLEIRRLVLVDALNDLSTPADMAAELIEELAAVENELTKV